MRLFYIPIVSHNHRVPPFINCCFKQNRRCNKSAPLTAGDSHSANVAAIAPMEHYSTYTYNVDSFNSSYFILFKGHRECLRCILNYLFVLKKKKFFFRVTIKTECELVCVCCSRERIKRNVRNGCGSIAEGGDTTEELLSKRRPTVGCLLKTSLCGCVRGRTVHTHTHTHSL